MDDSEPVDCGSLHQTEVDGGRKTGIRNQCVEEIYKLGKEEK